MMLNSQDCTPANRQVYYHWYTIKMKTSQKSNKDMEQEVQSLVQAIKDYRDANPPIKFEDALFYQLAHQIVTKENAADDELREFQRDDPETLWRVYFNLDSQDR